MAADQPLVIYPKTEDSQEAPTKKKMDDFADKWMAKKQGKSMVGQEVSLRDYLQN